MNLNVTAGSADAVVSKYIVQTDLRACARPFCAKARSVCKWVWAGSGWAAVYDVLVQDVR